VGWREAAGETGSVVSYAKGRSEALSWQRACGVKATGRGVMLMSCDTWFGSSGAPVLDVSSGTPRIVSLISRGNRDGAEVNVWGMEIAAPLEEVRRALQNGQDVWPIQEVSAKRLRVSDGTLADRIAAGQGPKRLTVPSN